jgi:hypothetical protein
MIVYRIPPESDIIKAKNGGALTSLEQKITKGSGRGRGALSRVEAIPVHILA